MSIIVEQLNITLNKQTILDDMSLTLPTSKITAILGPNGSGKSTFLKSIARLISPRQGSITLQGREVSTYSHRQFAQTLTLMPQILCYPQQITVLELVSFGRHPYQHWWSTDRQKDEIKIRWALSVVGMTHLSHNRLDELSGGQRQLAWLAMVIAQDTPYLLLDEPTSHLDLSHELNLLRLLKKLHHTQNKTIVIVLHDFNRACQFADEIVLINEGKRYAQGRPHEILTLQALQDVFKVKGQWLSVQKQQLFVPEVGE